MHGLASSMPYPANRPCAGQAVSNDELSSYTTVDQKENLPPHMAREMRDEYMKFEVLHHFTGVDIMKFSLLIGVILLALGILSLAYQGITYTSKEKVLDIGPIKAYADKTNSIPISPIVGAISVAIGLSLILVHRKT